MAITDPILATFVDATTFTATTDSAGQSDLREQCAIGVKIKANCGADGYKYGVVSAVSYNAPTTTIQITGDALTANLVSFWHGNDAPLSLPVHNHTSPADGGDLPGVMLTDNSRKFTEGYIQAEGSYTGFLFTQLGAPANAKKWIMHVAASRVALILTDDGETVFNEAWSVGRTGAVPTDMTITPLLVAAGGIDTDTFNGEDVTGGIVNTYLGLSVKSEVSITGTITLTASAFGKMHVCTGTTANYALGLPAAAGNAGKLLGIRISGACTKIVYLDANASELIDGETIRGMWAGESAVLLCDGVGWTKIAGKSIPMVCKLAATAVQSIPSGAFTAPRYDIKEIDNASIGVLAAGSITTRRAGFYVIVTHASLTSAVTWQINIFGTGGAASSVTSSAQVPVLVQYVYLAGGTAFAVNILQSSGYAVNTNVYPYPFLSVQEVVTW